MGLKDQITKDTRFKNKVGTKLKVHLFGVELDVINIWNEFGWVLHTIGDRKKLKPEALKELPGDFEIPTAWASFLFLNRFSRVGMRFPVIVPDNKEDFFAGQSQRTIHYLNGNSEWKKLDISKTDFEGQGAANSNLPFQLQLSNKLMADTDGTVFLHYLTHEETNLNTDPGGDGKKNVKKLRYCLISTARKLEGQYQTTQVNADQIDNYVTHLNNIIDSAEADNNAKANAQRTKKILEAEKELIRLTTELTNLKEELRSLEENEEETQEQEITKKDEIKAKAVEVFEQKKKLPAQQYTFMYEKKNAIQIGITIKPRVLNQKKQDAEYDKWWKGELPGLMSRHKVSKPQSDFEKIAKDQFIFEINADTFKKIQSKHGYELYPLKYSYRDQALFDKQGRITQEELKTAAQAKYDELKPTGKKFEDWLKEEWGKPQLMNLVIKNVPDPKYPDDPKKAEAWYLGKGGEPLVKVKDFKYTYTHGDKYPRFKMKMECTPPYQLPDIYYTDLTGKVRTEKKNVFSESSGWISDDDKWGKDGIFQSSFDSLEFIWKNDFKSDFRNLLNIAYKQYDTQLNTHPYVKLPSGYDKYPSLDEWILYALKDMNFST